MGIPQLDAIVHAGARPCVTRENEEGNSLAGKTVPTLARPLNLVIQRGARSAPHGRPRIQLGTRVLHLIENRVTDATVTGMRHATNLYRRAKRDARERRKGATP